MLFNNTNHRICVIKKTSGKYVKIMVEYGKIIRAGDLTSICCEVSETLDTKYRAVIGDYVSTETKTDFYSVYAYGNYIKVVYHKVGKIAQKERKYTQKPQKNAENEEKRFESSLSRSKNKVFEIACCNEFEYFCTFTQNADLRDRFDLKAFRKDFTMLIRNKNRVRGDFDKIEYLLIPEHHKNGAWHMHGLFKGLEIDKDLTPFKLSDNIPKRIKDTIRGGEPVYDWHDYRRRFGYFTCTRIKDNISVSKYITKYLSKEFSADTRHAGEHLYYASQGLKRRETLVKNSFDKCPFEEWDFENEYIKVKTFTTDDTNDISKLSLLF